MTLRPLFEWADALPSSIALRESLNAYPFLLTAHIVSMCLFAGLIVYWDLRLVGLVFKRVSVPDTARLLPLSLIGFAISVITGGLLLYSKPMVYYTNFYFWLKTGMIVLAGLNMMVFHFTTERSVSSWGDSAKPPRAAQLAGVVSLVLWAAIVATGRLIAYSGLVPQWWKNLNLGG